MEKSRLEFKIGSIEFIGEGDQDWLSKQLDKIIENIPKLFNYLSNVDKPEEKNADEEIVKSSPNEISTKINETLASFLKKKKAMDNQRRKFLATAVYLQLNGHENLTPKDITKALHNAKQTKLSNPSHQLSQNIKQGFCEKHGKSFYVTPEGISEIMEKQ